MLNVHFTRHGFADWVEFGNAALHVDYHHRSGHVDISAYKTEHVVRRNPAGEIMYEYDQRVCARSYVGRTEYHGENPLDAIPEIETLIREHIGKRVKINRQFVEAYMITNHKPLYDYTALDVPMYSGIDVRGLTVADMLARGVLNWSTYHSGYHIERIADLLDTPPVHAMSFIDFYALIHDNCHKQDFRDRVMSALGTVVTC